MADLISVPREVLQGAYDALEVVVDRWEAGSPTWTVAEQIDVLMHPEKAGLSSYDVPLVGHCGQS